MILSRGTSFSGEDEHDIDTHALYKLGLQALWEVNLRLATTDHLSNIYDGL